MKARDPELGVELYLLPLDEESTKIFILDACNLFNILI